MANAKTKEAPEERVELLIRKENSKDSHSCIIAVNGVNYVIPKGQRTMVPKHVAEEYFRSQRARDAQDNRKDELMAQAQKKAKEYGL